MIWTILENTGYLITRYLHLVCAMLLVGGTLFYEMVVPAAIDDLKQEHQLSVMGRARWVFRRIVWISAAFILVTGVLTTYRHWSAYTAAETATAVQVDDNGADVVAKRPGWWWAAHASTGVLAVLIALGLTMSKRPPEHPIQWMRINLVILLIVIFLASATSHVRSVVSPPPQEQERPGGGTTVAP